MERSLQIQSNVDMEAQCAKIATKRQANFATYLWIQEVRLRYGLNRFKSHALKFLIQYTASVGNMRTIALCVEKHNYTGEASDIPLVVCLSRKMSIEKENAVARYCANEMPSSKYRILRWKLFSSLEVIANGLNIHKMNIAENRSKLFNLQRRRIHFKRWKLIF